MPGDLEETQGPDLPQGQDYPTTNTSSTKDQSTEVLADKQANKDSVANNQSASQEGVTRSNETTDKPIIPVTGDNPTGNYDKEKQLDSPDEKTISDDELLKTGYLIIGETLSTNYPDLIKKFTNNNNEMYVSKIAKGVGLPDVPNKENRGFIITKENFIIIKTIGTIGDSNRKAVEDFNLKIDSGENMDFLFDDVQKLINNPTEHPLDSFENNILIDTLGNDPASILQTYIKEIISTLKNEKVTEEELKNKRVEELRKLYEIARGI